MKKYIPRLRTALGLTSAVLVLSVLLNFYQGQKVSALETQIESSYQKAFFETVTLMDGIGGNLEKMMITGSASMEQELLGDISRQADAAQDNLSMLPSSLPSISGALKFVNQLGDYSCALSDRIAAGGAVSDEDRELLLTLQTACGELNSVLLSMTDGIRQGVNPFSAAPDVPDVAVPLSSMTEPAVEYPSLLYDGPFSDGRSTGEMKALGGEQYSSEQALDTARSFIGQERIISARVTGEGTTPVPCWEIAAYVAEGELDLAVTKQGGQVVYMMLDDEPDESRFSQAELIDLAANFLKTRGYPQCSVSYWSFDDNLLTVNFAAMQDGVVLYPDLIKVQMSAQSGLAVGFEAVNYLTNHIRRTDLTPTLSKDEAQALLGPLLSVQHSRLCVIPVNSGEALCYEFSGVASGNQYLVYIDARTGQERRIYRVIQNKDGQLAV